MMYDIVVIKASDGVTHDIIQRLKGRRFGFRSWRGVAISTGGNTGRTRLFGV
jgi:hypothetical protein